MKEAGNNLANFLVKVLIVAIGVLVWNWVSLYIRHSMDANKDCETSGYYYRCISDEQFLNFFSAETWDRYGFFARLISIFLVGMVSLGLALAYEYLMKPFVDEYHRSKGSGEELVSAMVTTTKCYEQSCGCIQHDGVQTWPADFWDPVKGFWITPDSCCVNASCNCEYYHEGQTFDTTAGLWVRTDE